MSSKLLCVIDTCSIKVLTHLIIEDLVFGDNKVNYTLNKYFTFIVPDYILTDEIEGAMKSYKATFGVRDIPIDYSSFFEKVNYENYECCLAIVRNWITYKDIYIKEGTDEGEIRCMATSLYLSRKTKSNVIIMSDDKKARRKMLNDFADSQKIGLSMSFPDLILYLFSRYQVITKNQVEIFLREYYRVQPAKDVGKDVTEKYDSWLELSCRIIGTNTDTCKLDCMQ